MPQENEIDSFHHLLSESIQMTSLSDGSLSFLNGPKTNFEVKLESNYKKVIVKTKT